jgi:hypothetical protein
VSEIYGSRGYDSNSRTSDAHRSVPVVENGNECWAEDAEPLTRDEYAELMRRGPAAEGWDQREGDEDPDAANYADIDPILAEEDKLPTRDATGGDHPVYYDETDLIAADPENTDAATDAEREGGDHPLAEADPDRQAAARGDYPYHEPTVQDRARDQADQQHSDSAGETDADLRQQIADLKAEHDESIAQLKAENKDLRSENTEIRSEIAELRRALSALDARKEPVGQESQEAPAGLIHDKEQSQAEKAEKKAKQHPDRALWMSNEGMQAAAAVGTSVTTTVPLYWQYLPPTYTAITASVLGIGASAVALIRKNREIKDAAHRPEYRKADA